jgi:multidrug efflux pump subunit AcrA (membrane-fusion protein)
MSRARRARWLLAIVTLAAAAAVASWFGRARVAASVNLPTAVARRGEFLVIAACRGELVAGSSVQVTAPLNVPDLRIVWAAQPGAAVKAGEPIVRFDASSAERQLQEKEAALRQAQAQLEEALAQSRIALEQSRLELAKLRSAAERARLEASKGEILSALQAEEKNIDYDLAREKLKVQEAAAALIRSQNESKIASLRSQAAKHQAEADLTKKRLSQMELRSPSNGVVNFMMNYSQGWMNAKPFKAGDGAWPGSAIAEIPDLSSLRMKAKVEEIDRGRIHPGQEVRVHLDPFPEKAFPGELESISALAEQGFEWPPVRNFRAFARFREIDPRLRPAMNGRLDIIVDRLPDAVSVPAKAVFARDGRPVVLVPSEDGLKPVKVEILARNPDETAVRGIEGGTRVVLVEPGEERKQR